MEFKQCNNDLIKIESENFNITIKTTFKKSQLEKSVIDDKITELRNIFATILSENQKLQDKKLLEKLLENIGNKIKNNIDGIEISLSEEMCKLQSLSDYFNEYNEKFGEFGKTSTICGRSTYVWGVLVAHYPSLHDSQSSRDSIVGHHSTYGGHDYYSGKLFLDRHWRTTAYTRMGCYLAECSRFLANSALAVDLSRVSNFYHCCVIKLH